MLVLSRKVNEDVLIGDNVVVRVTQIERGKVKLGFIAPDSVRIHRREVYDRIRAEQSASKEDVASGEAWDE